MVILTPLVTRQSPLDIMTVNTSMRGGQLALIKSYDGTSDAIPWLLTVDNYKAQDKWGNEETATAMHNKLKGLARQWSEAQATWGVVKAKWTGDYGFREACPSPWPPPRSPWPS